MKVIIPAKCNSSRTLNKNWREFIDGKCLVEVKIGQLIEAGVNAADINVFCEEESKRSKVAQLGAKFVLRDAANTKDDMYGKRCVWEDSFRQARGLYVPIRAKHGTPDGRVERLSIRAFDFSICEAPSKCFPQEGCRERCRLEPTASVQSSLSILQCSL